MYPVPAAAKNRCPTDIRGVAQNATSRPSIIGWRIHAYSQRSRNGGDWYVPVHQPSA